MKKFYLHDGQQQLGPYSIQELKDQQISASTHVWQEGFIDWIRAGDLPELATLFIATPPPFKPVKTTQPQVQNNTPDKSTIFKTGSWIGRNPKRVLYIVIALSFICIAVYSFITTMANSDTSGSSIFSKSPEELKKELRQKEEENPANYLKPVITMRGNLIGQTVFEGTISNNASAATFKDAAIKISYLSKTGALISIEKFMIYEIVGPQQKVPIKKIKTFAPNGTENFSVEVVAASVVN